LAKYSRQFYEGVRYHGILTATLEERIKELLNSVRSMCIHNLEDMQAVVECLMDTILQSSNSLTCYMDVRGGMAWNYGILIKYNLRFLPVLQAKLAQQGRSGLRIYAAALGFVGLGARSESSEQLCQSQTVTLACVTALASRASCSR